MKIAFLPPSCVTAVLLIVLALTGEIGDIRINAGSIAPLFCAGAFLMIAWDMRTLGLNSERSSRNDDIPELTDEEFRAHHALYGSILPWWAIPQMIPVFWFGAAGKTAVSLILFFASLIGTGIFCKQKFRPILEQRRAGERRELELQRKRESGWR